MRNITILSLIAIFLGLFVYFYEIEGEKKRVENFLFDESLFKIKQDDIKAITLINNSKIIKYEKNNEVWEITDPVKTSVEESTVNSQLNSFVNAKIKRKMEVDLINKKDYGFTLFSPEIIIETINGDKINFEVGDESSSKGDIFVSRKDSNFVILTSNDLKIQSQKSLFDLRDKKIIHFDKSIVYKIYIETEDDKIIIENVDQIINEWKIISHDDLIADNSQIDNYLNSLNRFKAVEFIDKENTNEKYGFKNPSFAIKLFLGDDNAIKEIKIGNEQISESDTNHFGHESGKANSYLISNNDKNDLIKNHFYFQEKKLINYIEDEIKEIHILGSHKLSVFKEDTLGWYVSLDSTIKLQKSDINRIFSAINGIQAIEFIGIQNDNLYSLDDPFLEIFLNDVENKEIGFRIGESDNSLNRFSKSNYSNRIYKVTNNSIERLINIIDEIKGQEKE